MFDEYNQPNKSLRELLGVDQTELVKPDAEQVYLIASARFSLSQVIKMSTCSGGMATKQSSLMSTWAMQTLPSSPT